MASYAFFRQVLPGKLDAWLRYQREMAGPRKEEVAAHLSRLGITKERVWLQRTPRGDFIVAYFEADDIQGVFSKAAESQHPFDLWFLQYLTECFGAGPSGTIAPLNQPVMEFTGKEVLFKLPR